MAAEKSSEKKIMDVARPGRTAATPTSRPVVITNRPLINQDPMVAAGSDGGTETAKTVPVKTAEEPLVHHGEKIIKPPKASEAEEEPEAAAEEPVVEATTPAEEPAKTKEEATEEVTPAEPEVSEEKPTAPAAAEADPEPAAAPEAPAEEPEAPTEEATPAESDEASDEASDDDKQINPDAVKEVSEAEKHRAAELEEIIASGKYHVPVNSSANHRNRIITLWLIVLTLLLAVALLDALLDVGILNVQGVPHTHFFSLTSSN